MEQLQIVKITIVLKRFAFSNSQIGEWFDTVNRSRECMSIPYWRNLGAANNSGKISISLTISSQAENSLKVWRIWLFQGRMPSTGVAPLFPILSWELHESRARHRFRNGAIANGCRLSLNPLNKPMVSISLHVLTIVRSRCPNDSGIGDFDRLIHSDFPVLFPSPLTVLFGSPSTTLRFISESFIRFAFDRFILGDSDRFRVKPRMIRKFSDPWQLIVSRKLFLFGYPRYLSGEMAGNHRLRRRIECVWSSDCLNFWFFETLTEETVWFEIGPSHDQVRILEDSRSTCGELWRYSSVWEHSIGFRKPKLRNNGPKTSGVAICTRTSDRGYLPDTFSWLGNQYHYPYVARNTVTHYAKKILWLTSLAIKYGWWKAILSLEKRFLHCLPFSSEMRTRIRSRWFTLE
jgi:hypothetical protein